MSVFSNPSSRSPEMADDYVRAILDLLDDRDPMEVLRATPATVHALVAGLSDRVLSAPEAQGKWSVREAVRHLADSEIVWAYRLRMVLAQDRPTLHGYDQDAWAVRLGYRDADVGATLDEFSSLRTGNLGLLGRVAPEDLARVGVHAERGEESVGRMIQLYAGHDLVHLAQIRRILEALGDRDRMG